MGMGTSKPGPAGSTPAGRGASLRSYFISPPTSPPATPDSSPPHSPRSPLRATDARAAGRHTTTQPTPIASPSRPVPVPLTPFSGVNMCVSPSGPVPTGQERVATVFTWTQGGKNVAVTGTWNNWQGVIPLNRSEHDFTAIIDLPPGVHQYKYIVDGKWTHAADQPVATDSRGNINNCMEIKEFRLGQSKNNALGRGSPPGSYTQEIPELIKFNDMFDEDLPGTPGPGAQKKKPDEPPVLPPHLLGTRAVLNTTTDDPTVLPLPNHVMLNHLYFKKHEDDHKRDILILGTTQRYREKFVTTVFYKAAPSLSDVNSGSTTTSPSVPRTRPPPPPPLALNMSGHATSTKPVARQLFSPRDGDISDTIGSPRGPADDPRASSATATNHPTTALTMDRGSGGTNGGAGGGAGVPTSAMDIVAKRRVSVSGDGAVLGRSPVQDEGPGTDAPPFADYSLRHNMG